MDFGECNSVTSSDVINLSMFFRSLSLFGHFLVHRIYLSNFNVKHDISWGRLLYSDSITIRYKLFYWSRHFCPMSRADPVFLGVRGDGNNRNLFFVRTIVPEYSVSGRSGLLRIGFEDFFSLGSYETGKFVSLKALVSRIL